jgi:transketolase
MAIEDMAMMRTLPNMAVINPADARETEAAVEYLLDHEGPAFLRLTRQGVEDVTPDDYSFELGKAVRLRDGSDVAILATGAQVGESMKAAEILDKSGISAEVVNVHTIAPLDEEAVLEAATSKKGIVTVEDHSIRGGLGGAVAELLASRKGSTAPLHRIGMTTFGESGTTEDLYAKYGLNAEGIAGTVKSFVEALS